VPVSIHNIRHGILISIIAVISILTGCNSGIDDRQRTPLSEVAPSDNASNSENVTSSCDLNDCVVASESEQRYPDEANPNHGDIDTIEGLLAQLENQPDTESIVSDDAVTPLQDNDNSLVAFGRHR